MLLRGNLKEFSLPNVLQLVHLSARSGVLTVRRDDQWGRIFFCKGLICYAFSVPQSTPLGAFLVRNGEISVEQLRRALTAQEQSTESARIGGILLAQGAIDRAVLERAVREQIQGVAFDFFGWPDGQFEFGEEDEAEAADDQDILVEMHVENVIMEGGRRIDEWKRFVDHVGPMEGIPHLALSGQGTDLDEIVLSTEEWRAVVHMDGRTDINAILRYSGLDRFHGARVMYGLHSRGLISVGEPVTGSVARTLSVAVRGSVDANSEAFLTMLADGGGVRQMRVEIVDDGEEAIPVLAGRAAFDSGIDEVGILVFTAPASVSDEAWRRVAGQANAWVVLANANDVNSLLAARLDLEFVRGMGRLPLVVGCCGSMIAEKPFFAHVPEILRLDAGVPVVPCHLHDRESVAAVVRGLLRHAAT